MDIPTCQWTHKNTNCELHRRHWKLVWVIYGRTDFSHLKQGGVDDTSRSEKEG